MYDVLQYTHCFSCFWGDNQTEIPNNASDYLTLEPSRDPSRNDVNSATKKKKSIIFAYNLIFGQNSRFTHNKAN